MSRCTLHPHFLNSFDPFLTVDLFSSFIWDNNVKKELKHRFIFSFYRYYVAWKLCTSECLALRLLCSFFLLFTHLVLDVMPHSACTLILVRISRYSVQMLENTDQNNSKYGHFLRSGQYTNKQFKILCQKKKDS